MSTLRRSAVLGGALALLAGLSFPTPALAAPPTVRITTPGSGEEVPASDVTVVANITMENGSLVNKVRLELVRCAPSCDKDKFIREVAPARTVSFPLSLALNGRYKVTVKADGVDEPLDLNGAETGVDQREFVIAARPAPPQEVKAVVDPATRTVTLTWKANGEPDLIGYVVQRAKGDGPFADLGPVSKTDSPTYRDVGTAEAGGVYRYQVVAVRSDGITKDKGISSDPSAVTPEATATVADPPAPPSGTPGTTVVASTSGASATPGTTGAPANKPGALTTSGSVDLSGFKSLQSQARSSTPPRTSRPRDTGFKSTLPFVTTEPREEGEVLEEGGELGEVAADSPQFRELGTEDDGSQRQESLAFLAAGLLATVLLMHVLWIKSEVKRAPLEPLAPE